MNLAIHQAPIFKRRLYCAVILYTAMGATVAGVSIHSMRSVSQHIFLLEKQVEQLKNGLKTEPLLTIKKEEHHTMEDVKNQLTQLFSLPLPGISFNVLSLNEEGMHVRGNARTPESLEAWLGHVSEAFLVDRHSSQPKAGKGLAFEVLLHEKN